MKTRFLKTRLTLLVFIQFAIWGAYLISIGRYLGMVGLGSYIKWFFALNGMVSLFMPALMGVVSDRYVEAQRTLSGCHLLSGAFMIAAGMYCLHTPQPEFRTLFALYGTGILFFMPTIALTYSVSYNALTREGMDCVKEFPPIRAFGTVGFICSMLVTNWVHINGVSMQDSGAQLAFSGMLSLVMCIYALTMPNCPVASDGKVKSVSDAFSIQAFSLFRNRQMAVFFIFSILMGSALQITNGYANNFLSSFSVDPALADTFAVKNSNAFLSLSQISETLCILLIPIFMKRFGIKGVMLMSMVAWVLRFGLLGLGSPDMPGVLLFVLSCVIYGLAFDFFNIAGSLYVDQNAGGALRSSAQGLFMLMTNGVGATVGILVAGAVMDKLVFLAPEPDWSSAWYIFAGYMTVVTVLFALLFKKPSKSIS